MMGRCLLFNNMNKFLVTIIYFFSLISNAQEVGVDFFQTWYLYNILSDDLSNTFNIQNTNPRIAPEVTFAENFEFSGFGGCNTFQGTFEIGGTNENPLFITTSFSSENNECSTSENNQIDNTFLDLIMSGEFEISLNQTDDGLGLYLFTALGGVSDYGIAPLSINDLKKEKISSYPNPVSDRLYFNFNETIVSSIKLYNISGKLVFATSIKIESMDVKNYEDGVYFLHIQSKNKVLINSIIIQ